jgi:Calx-beta domain
MRALPKSVSTTLFLSLLLSLTAHGAFAQTEVNITGVPAAASEGTGAGTTPFVFTVSRSAPGPAVNVTYTIGGDVVAPEDYTALSGTLAFTAAQNSRTITVAIKRDTKFEIDEDLTLTLTGTDQPGVVDVGATSTATTQVLNDDTPPTISIGNRTVAEGTLANFVVTLSNGSYLPVSVTATTSDGTANGVVTAPFPLADYTTNAPGGTVVTFAANATVLTQNFGVQTINDTVYEGGSLGTPETYFVDLSAPANGSIGVGTGNGFITDNDQLPTVAIAGIASQLESAGTYTFTVTLNRQSYEPINIPAATQDAVTTGTNSTGVPAFTGDPQDFIPHLSTLNFLAGETSKNVVVTVNDDVLDEFNEAFSLVLTNPANVSNPGALSRAATLNDDDVAPTISITAPSPLNEADGTATFTVSLSAPSGKLVSVTASTNPPTGTALSGTDYTATTSPLSWGLGIFANQNFDVPINGDALDEIDETFRVSLTGATNATLSTSSATATILDDDAPPTVSIGDVTLAEGNAGTTNFGFTVSLSGPSGKTITVRASTADGTATTANTDYVPRTNVLLTFSPLQTSQLFDVTVNGDTVLENDETFAVNLSSPSATVTIADGTGDGTIQNDDSPALSISDATIGETDSGQVSLNFDVSIPDPAPVGGVTFDFDTTDGTATVADNDYDAVVAAPGFIPEGDTTVQMTVLVNGDLTVEAHETLTATISNADVPGIPGGIVTILDATATGTIVNDDAVPVGALVISEFRLRGPGGVNDEFIEIANRTSSDITVFTTDFSAGFSVARSGGTQVFVIPNGTTIPARGHFLGVNSLAYSLEDYGGTGAAAGDATWMSGIPDDSGLALFASADQPNYPTATPLDAVGFVGEPAQYLEGTGLTGIGAGPFANNYSFVRKHQVGPGAALQDTGDSAADFALVAVDAGTYGAVLSLLGGPSPENLAAEVEQLTTSMPMTGTGGTASVSPAVRSLEFPRTFTNNTGGIVNALRFKVSSITTIHSPGLVADLRVTDSTAAGSFEGLTLEGMPAAGYSSPTPAFGGRNAGVLLNGGLNSTLRLTTALPIAPAGTIDVNFRVEYTLSGRPFLLWVVPEVK